MAWIAANSYRTLGEVTIGQWIEWERGWTIRQYLNELKSGLWGGALEITLLSIIMNVNVEVFDRISGSNDQGLYRRV